MLFFQFAVFSIPLQCICLESFSGMVKVIICTGGLIRMHNIPNCIHVRGIPSKKNELQCYKLGNFQVIKLENGI